MPKTARHMTRRFLIALSGKPSLKGTFKKEMRKVFREKNREKLWWINMPTRIWDGKNYHVANYRCCPKSHRARNIFCLVLDREAEPGKILVREGYLESF